MKRVLGFDRDFDERDVLWIVLVLLLVLWRVVVGLCFRFATRAGGYKR